MGARHLKAVPPLRLTEGAIWFKRGDEDWELWHAFYAWLILGPTRGLPDDELLELAELNDWHVRAAAFDLAHGDVDATKQMFHRAAVAMLVLGQQIIQDNLRMCTAGQRTFLISEGQRLVRDAHELDQVRSLFGKVSSEGDLSGLSLDELKTLQALMRKAKKLTD